MPRQYARFPRDSVSLNGGGSLQNTAFTPFPFDHPSVVFNDPNGHFNASTPYTVLGPGLLRVHWNAAVPLVNHDGFREGPSFTLAFTAIDPDVNIGQARAVMQAAWGASDWPKAATTAAWFGGCVVDDTNLAVASGGGFAGWPDSGSKAGGLGPTSTPVITGVVTMDHLIYDTIPNGTTVSSKGDVIRHNAGTPTIITTISQTGAPVALVVAFGAYGASRTPPHGQDYDTGLISYLLTSTTGYLGVA